MITGHSSHAKVTQSIVTQPLQLAASAQIYKLIYSTMFQNKVHVVLQELSANALDAHKAVGKENIPIQIELPTILNPYLIVTDEGIGMSLAVVENVYNTYGNSNKNTSNEAIGGFGYGGKSPFSIADSYTVKTTHKGNTVNIGYYLDNGYPKCTIMDVGNIGLSDGTVITVPVSDEKHQDQFKKEAETLFTLWSTPPAITPKITFSNYFEEIMENCGFIQSQNFTRYQSFSLQVAVGPFIYQIPKELKDSVLLKVPVEIKNYRGAFLLKFQIGELELSPSREWVEDTSSNLEALTKKLEACSNFLKEYLENFTFGQYTQLSQKIFAGSVFLPGKEQKTLSSYVYTPLDVLKAAFFEATKTPATRFFLHLFIETLGNVLRKNPLVDTTAVTEEEGLFSGDYPSRLYPHLMVFPRLNSDKYMWNLSALLENSGFPDGKDLKALALNIFKTHVISCYSYGGFSTLKKMMHAFKYNFNFWPEGPEALIAFLPLTPEATKILGKYRRKFGKGSLKGYAFFRLKDSAGDSTRFTIEDIKAVIKLLKVPEKIQKNILFLEDLECALEETKSQKPSSKTPRKQNTVPKTDTVPAFLYKLDAENDVLSVSSPQQEVRSLSLQRLTDITPPEVPILVGYKPPKKSGRKGSFNIYPCSLSPGDFVTEVQDIPITFILAPSETVFKGRKFQAFLAGLKNTHNVIFPGDGSNTWGPTNVKMYTTKLLKSLPNFKTYVLKKGRQAVYYQSLHIDNLDTFHGTTITPRVIPSIAMLAEYPTLEADQKKLLAVYLKKHPTAFNMYKELFFWAETRYIPNCSGPQDVFLAAGYTQEDIKTYLKVINDYLTLKTE